MLSGDHEDIIRVGSCRQEVSWQHPAGGEPATAGGRFVMASKYYCTNIGEELEVWSTKLHKLSSKIDRMPSIDKYRLLPHIEELHIIMTEMDDRLCDMMTECPTVEPLEEEDSDMLSLS